MAATGECVHLTIRVTSLALFTVAAWWTSFQQDVFNNPELAHLFFFGRQAEATFMQEAERVFDIEEVPDAELHEVYQTVDVTVLRLRRKSSVSKHSRRPKPAEPPP